MQHSCNYDAASIFQAAITAPGGLAVAFQTIGLVELVPKVYVSLYTFIFS